MDKDMTDLSASLGAKALSEVIQKNAIPVHSKKPLPSQRAFPVLASGDSFVREKVSAPRELIKGIMHAGDTAVLGGGSKTNKTWTLLDIGLSVANGCTWWGRESCKAKVIYINLELAPWVLQERLQTIQAKKTEITSMDNFFIWNLRGFPTTMKELVDEALITFANHEIGLVIVDPIYRLYGGMDENNASQMTGVFTELERLAHTTKAAVIFGAHFSKGNQANKEAMDRISGSGAFARFPDVILTLTKNKEDDIYDVEATLRNLRSIPAFCVRWKYPLMEISDIGTPGNLKQMGQKKPIYSEKQLLEVLGDKSMRTCDWKTAVINKTSMSDGTFSKLKKDLVDKKSVVEDGGKWKARQADSASSATDPGR